MINQLAPGQPSSLSDRIFPTSRTTLHWADCMEWLDLQKAEAFHGVITDPPYGMIEYTEEQLAKRKAGNSLIST